MDKFLNKIEVHFVRSIVLTIYLGLTFNHLLIQYTNYGVQTIESINLTKAIKETIIDKEGVLTTLASVFIGIYFTVYTLLGSVKKESTFASITKNNFFKLLDYILHAMFGAIGYLFASMFSTYFFKYNTVFKPYYLIFIFSLLLYIFLSAIRFGLFTYFMLKRDIGKLHQQLEDSENEKKELKRTLFRLNSYLTKQEEADSLLQSSDMRKYLQQRKRE